MAYVDRTRIAQNTWGARLMAIMTRITEDRARRALYSRTVQELNALTDRDLADLGISRLQIEDVAREAAYGM
jgi:uncharacterized protein YjiS (DUF1127 family)